ncbi:GNAT family N-acetyltransferase [Micromonospora echinofusca]|uniref:GNAT family N-acetyltransferase n=1 Tax=Micromonospora echinofusca TaxID=47858 RepID=A0ABS3VMR8_MICEH|nr:GNAT family N-acetyltransferase [Micromonospora echinofusca]MBO4205820.1 GNAT family N-acetyltransferase [Micromonospora echinofusca]
MITGEVTSLDTPADPALDAAVELLASSVPTACAGLAAYHAPRFRSFLAAALAPPPAARTVLLRCLRSGDRLDAVADWRRLPGGELLLNGIAVRPDERGRGHGGRLLRDGAGLAGQVGCDRLLLDVSLDNPGARRLYDRLGFVARQDSVWWPVPIRSATGAAPVRVTDWPAFVAHRDAYGFGDLTLHTPTGPAVVRLVGDVLRVPPGPVGRDLPAVVAALVPVSRAYTIEPAGGSLDGSTPALATFTRMHRPVGTG